MKYSLTIRKEAESDINSAFDYYENQRLGLGHDFLLCTEAALSKIERNPLHYKTIHKELRRIAVHRFPYRFLFSSRSIGHSDGRISCKEGPSIVERTHITKGCKRHPKATRFLTALQTGLVLVIGEPSRYVQKETEK